MKIFPQSSELIHIVIISWIYLLKLQFDSLMCSFADMIYWSSMLPCVMTGVRLTITVLVMTIDALRHFQTG